MMFFLLIWSMSALGFFAIAASMAKHQKQIFQRLISDQHSMLLKVLGWVLLLIALILCLISGPLSNMASYWIGSLTFAALAVGLSFSYFESKIKAIVIGFTWLMLMSCSGYFI